MFSDASKRKEKEIMNAGKQCKAENKIKDAGDREFEHPHHSLFSHPDSKKWDATSSLAQPSFLKQVDSRGRGHTAPVKASPAVFEEQCPTGPNIIKIAIVTGR